MILTPHTLAALVSSGWGCPRSCHLRQQGLLTFLFGGSQMCIQSLCCLEAGSGLDRSLPIISHLFSPFPYYFTFPMATANWDLPW